MGSKPRNKKGSVKQDKKQEPKEYVVYLDDPVLGEHAVYGSSPVTEVDAKRLSEGLLGSSFIRKVV